ncbi:hypothetical protein P0Y35_14300 [Kiritimatiellaeota bacterium B1221]|nr:hypothetical protein [Kiritimatiellaeota bacterium B1221]
MSIHLELTYGKKIGLPEYSSHNFNVSLKAEVANADDIPGEVQRIYQTLQQSVDDQIINPGYVPGQEVPEPSVRVLPPQEKAWNCSPKQKELILKLVDEQNLDRLEVDDRAQERFGKGVTQLNKLEASGLIDSLMPQGRSRKPQRRAA